MRPLPAVLCFLIFAEAAHAQSSCPQLEAPAPDPAKLLFTPQQEQELGQIIQQQLESRFLVIEDEQVTGFLKRVGERVVRHLPNTGLHYDFLLYDQPEVQAFSMPGGHIYVSRKMVAFLRNEDELAGLLGHELGHLAARQQALELSAQFREVLGLKSVPADEELSELYQQFVESVRLRNHRFGSKETEDKNQRIADQLGVQAVARAGYSPQPFSDLLDRIMQTKGKTGSWLSDLFGATSPNSKRLREALKDVENLPASCIETRELARSEEFLQWQSAVLHYHGIGHPENLSGVLTRKSLADPLRGDIEEFRFSPDGKYFLAQDEGGIYVITRDPLKFIFRIEAPGAQSTKFTPDSQRIVFVNFGLGVESWNINRQELENLTDVPTIHGCRQTEISPDAKYLGCFDGSLNLKLYDVASGETIFEKDKFFAFESGINPYAFFSRVVFLMTHPKDLVAMKFTPDARYFAASSATGQDVVIDLNTRAKVSVSGAVHTALRYSFAFLGSNRIIGADIDNPKNSPIAEFPSGKVIDRIPLDGAKLASATNPRYFLIRPVKDHAVEAFDTEGKKLVLANRMAATDIWGDTAVSERLNGEIGLYKVGETKTSTVLRLPIGKLGNLKAFTASSDLKWLAMSTKTRGGVWSIVSGTRSFGLRGFTGAYYAPSAIFYLDFPQFEKLERETVVLSPITLRSNSRPVDKDDDQMFFGDVLLRITHREKNRELWKNFDLTGLDIVNEKPLWSRTFSKDGPEIAGSPSSGSLIFVWRGKSEGLREELGRDAKLQAAWNKDKPSDADYFLEVLNAHDGGTKGTIAVHTGKYSFLPEHEETQGDWVVVADNLNRVLLYSMSTGERRAKWFGYLPHISPRGDWLCLQNGRGHLITYDLKTLKKAGEFSFANSISGYSFSDDGKRLFVLTNDQSAFVLDATGSTTQAAAKN